MIKQRFSPPPALENTPPDVRRDIRGIAGEVRKFSISMYPWKEERGKEGQKPRESQETLLTEVTSALFLRRAFEKNMMESSFLHSLSSLALFLTPCTVTLKHPV